MNGFEFNKIMAAVLVSLLIGMVAGILSDGVVSPQKLEKNAYEIAAADDSAGGAGGAASGPAPIEPIEPLLASANIENGQNIAKRCLQCHGFEEGGAHKIGPNLWNIVSAKIAAKDGYAYSNSLKEKSSENWTYAHLNDFIAKPKQFASGTKMTFAGLAKTQDRADLIAYLRSLSSSPAPLP